MNRDYLNSGQMNRFGSPVSTRLLAALALKRERRALGAVTAFMVMAALRFDASPPQGTDCSRRYS